MANRGVNGLYIKKKLCNKAHFSANGGKIC